MIDDREIVELLRSAKTIAVIGLSDKPWRPSFGVTEYMMSRGYEIIPVNPEISQSLGKVAYDDLNDIPNYVEIVNIFRDSRFVSAIVDRAIAIRAKCIWMQEGIRDDEAAERARSAGLLVVQDSCILKYHQRLLD